MTDTLSETTQAILLLTAPLIVSRRTGGPEPLTLGEYKRLVLVLRGKGKSPADFLARDRAGLVEACGEIAPAKRIEALLDRGFVLSQALEAWMQRSIWVLSRADTAYPRLIKERLGGDTPPILYGCGNAGILSMRALAIVGSREASEDILDYARNQGAYAAGSGVTVVSGGARGIDRAGMLGAIEAGGKVAGILVDHLKDAVVAMDFRAALMRGDLVLVSPYDPSMGFTVGNAMARNKLVYACADAALIVESDAGKGGTWAGVREQLARYRRIPLYRRAVGTASPGLDALGALGVLPWPEPKSAGEWDRAVRPHSERESGGAKAPAAPTTGRQALLEVQVCEEPAEYTPSPRPDQPPEEAIAITHAVEEVEARDRVLKYLATPRTLEEVVALFGTTKRQTREWLAGLVESGLVEKTTKPVRYMTRPRELFDDAGF